MQPLCVGRLPIHIPDTETPGVYACNLQRYLSATNDGFRGAGCKSPSHSKSPMTPPWGRRRAESGQDRNQIPASTSESPRRSSPNVSPPAPPASSARTTETAIQLQPPPTEPIRRRRTRLSSLIRRQPSETEVDRASNAPRQQYIAYTPDVSTLPRSAPSVITAFPSGEDPRPSLPPTHPYSAVSPSVYGSPRSDPTSTTTPYGLLARDPWGAASSGSWKPLESTDPRLSFSPVSNASSDIVSPLSAVSGPSKRFTTSSDPGRVQRSVSTTAVPARRDSEAASDAFASPFDVALFAEATSSLSIGDFGMGPIVRRPVPPRQVTPLAPVPQGSVPSPQRAVSLGSPPLRAQSLPPRQPRPPPPVSAAPSRAQLAAEALLGVGGVDEGEISEDELPNYNQSQIEANVRSRIEATKRAKELDEAWRRGRRFGEGS